MNLEHLDQFAEKMAPRLRRYFLGVSDESQSWDLAQEALLRLLSSYRLGRFDQSKGSLEMWSYGFARKVKLEFQRKVIRDLSFKNIEEISNELGSEPTAEPAAVGAIRRKELRQSLNQLPEQQQEVILLWMDKDLQMSEISKLLKIPINTVKSHLRRGKENLKIILEREDNKNLIKEGKNELR